MTTGNRTPPTMAFFSATLVLFACFLSAAESVGFVPYYVDGTTPSRSVALANLPMLGEGEAGMPVAAPETIAPEESGVLPDRIVIASIGIDLPVQNVESRDLAVLDEALHAGPVRYVDSARAGAKGNTLIFGHSSRLPVVHNQMYKAFNRLSELSAGDTIRVEGEGRAFLYSVTGVKQVDAADAKIDLAQGDAKRLTLVTCDNLTGKSARFVVEAEFIGEV